MEQIGKVLDQTMGRTLDRREQRGRGPESAASTPPRAQTNEPEPLPDQYKIHPNEAKAKGYTYNSEPPASEPCPYCGRMLYHYGAIMPGQKHVFTWFEETEHCTCPQAQEYWKQQEAAQRAAETAEKRRKEQERIQARIGRLIKDSGIRGRFLNRTFDRFEVTNVNRKAYSAAKRYADSFPIMLPAKDRRGRITPPAKERNGLFISGTKGTGKTHLAASIANQLIQGGTPVICMTMIDLLARVKQTFDRPGEATEAEIMRIYEEVPLLIIDDIGTEQPTTWGITQIYTIINARYEAYMPIIITTNYSGENLIRRMTPDRDDGITAAKTISRLTEMCSGIEMIWDDWRTK